MKNECVHKHNWLTMIRCNIAIPKIPLHCDNYYLSCIDIIPAYHPNMDGRVSYMLRSFVNFVTQGYKGTVGSSREFRHLMTKEV